MSPMAILLATDGSPEARAAAEWLDRWVQPAAAHITLVTVITPPSFSWTIGPDGYVLDAAGFAQTYHDLLAEEEAAARAALAATAQELAHCPPVATEILLGHPAAAIVTYAQTHRQDLIVMGRRGHSALGNLMGSVSFAVLHRSPIPVTIVS
ncbi:MAG: universal stress protein [Firmicutes bacterium]|nr:universal stress protein [Bacillota bacterium]